MTVIRVGTQAPRFEGTALFYDGDVPIPRATRISIDEAADTLVIEAEEIAPRSWPLTDVRQLRDRGGDDMVLMQAGDPLPRLLVSGAEEKRIIRARAPNLDRSPKIKGKRKLFFLAIAAIGSVVLMILFLVPLIADGLADYLPPEGERALGEATLEQVRSAFDTTGFLPLAVCENAEGRAALAKIETRITEAVGYEDELTLSVLDHEMVNAFALPGGYIVFFRGLIEDAESPDEIAAVFAHELGHVDARDPTRIALRSAGSIGLLGLLFGDFAGGAMVLFLVERIIQADYTQEAEAAADAYAHAAMNAANLRPDAMADFFERLREEYGDEEGIVAHFLSHPAMGDRIDAARQATPDEVEFDAVLTEDEFAALKSICDYTY
ncbi:M48 family metallopeptidase [Aestuariibius sp. 2305UL40-4]|uniref:M48 family metallopeptidase n=1 Tax=Aestuariibius violaceus TaxID=3234132 RepID=UPI00345EC011